MRLMNRVLLNYFGLLVSLLGAVAWRFGLPKLPPVFASVTAWLLLALFVLVALRLMHPTQGGTDTDLAEHVRWQRRILFTVVVGSLLETLAVLLFYEQLRLRVNIVRPLAVAAAVMWAGCIVVAALGAIRVVRDRFTV